MLMECIILANAMIPSPKPNHPELNKHLSVFVRPFDCSKPQSCKVKREAVKTYFRKQAATVYFYDTEHEPVCLLVAPPVKEIENATN